MPPKKKGCSDFFGLFCPILRVCVCVCVFGSVLSSHLIADKELETEKKQNEAELKRGRVYYEKIKDPHKIVPSNGFCFLMFS